MKDGSGGGWPLYANIKITGPGAPTFNIQTDPVTGYYSIVLVQGLTYTFPDHVRRAGLPAREAGRSIFPRPCSTRRAAS